jgi:hypothetical protein
VLGQNGSVSDGREVHAGGGNDVLPPLRPERGHRPMGQVSPVVPENVTAAGGPAEALSTEGCW